MRYMMQVAKDILKRSVMLMPYMILDVQVTTQHILINNVHTTHNMMSNVQVM